jgi:hypothetical protein
MKPETGDRRSETGPAAALISRWWDDKWSILLGTGYRNFSSRTGIEGLGRVQGDTLDLLAVATRTPGRGQFRDFMRLAKAEFAAIELWAVGNAQLAQALRRYGFTPCRRVEPWGERVAGFRWTKKQP